MHVYMFLLIYIYTYIHIDICTMHPCIYEGPPDGGPGRFPVRLPATFRIKVQTPPVANPLSAPSACLCWQPGMSLPRALGGSQKRIHPKGLYIYTRGRLESRIGVLFFGSSQSSRFYGLRFGIWEISDFY